MHSFKRKLTNPLNTKLIETFKRKNKNKNS